MKYLNFTTVLPLGSPSPDLSGQPALDDFMPPALWKRRLELRDHQARYEEQPAPEPEHPDVAEFRKASQKCLQAVRQHTQTVENAHNIEFCNWSVHSTTQPRTGPVLWISHAQHADGEEHPYTIQGVFRLINNRYKKRLTLVTTSSAPLQGLSGECPSGLRRFTARSLHLRRSYTSSTLIEGSN